MGAVYGLRRHKQGEVLAEESSELAEVAALLQSGLPIRESKRAETKERMLREFARTRPEARDGAGSQDSPVQSVHTAEVIFYDGIVRLADVEPISEAKAAEIAQQVSGIEAQREDR